MVPARWMLGAALCAALLVAIPASPSAPGIEQIALRLGRLEALVEDARFRQAVQEAVFLRSQALALPPSAEARRLLVRAEVVAGVAALALGEATTARRSFQRALQLEPALSLDASTPPKLRRSFDAVRGGL
jgi:hypothetical protein